MKKALFGLLVLALIAGAAAAVVYFRLTAPVEVATTPPVAATLPPETDQDSVPATPTSAVVVPTTSPTQEETTLAQVTATSIPSTSQPTSASTSVATTAPQTAAVPTPTTRPTAVAAGPTVYRIDPERSSATYRVQETFLEDARVTTAEGTTNAVAGEVRLNPSNVARSRVGEIVVDISQLESDEPRRDNAIRRQWLESARYPRATFANAVISSAPDSIAEGEPFTFEMTGDMTIKEATRKQTWDVTATVEDDLLRGTATTQLQMSQYGVDPPNIGGFVAVEDDVELTLEFVAEAVR